MTAVVLASTLFGLATAVTVLDNEPASSDDRPLLVTTNNAPMAEIVPDLSELDGFEAVADRFDDVVSLNALIAPYHPSLWHPGEDGLAVLQRLVRAAWHVRDGPSRLLVESIQVRPARTLAQLFPDSPITVYADGLMSYGPTRNRLPPGIFARIERLVFPDLVPGVAPLLLGEHGVTAETFPLELLGKTLETMSASVMLPTDSSPATGPARGDEQPTAMIIGQSMGPLGLLSHADEQNLHVRMLAVARSHGANAVLFKPHPNSPPSLLQPMRAWASANNVRFGTVSSRAPVEALLERIRPAVMIGAFSTALVTGRRLYSVPCLQVGARDLLRSLKPYENSNRIPLVVVDATIPDGEVTGPRELDGWTALSAPALSERVRAVGYLMQPELRADLRTDAEVVIARDGATSLNVTRDRLTRLGLPGGYPAGPLLTRAVDSAPGKVAYRALRKVQRDGFAEALRSVRQ